LQSLRDQATSSVIFLSLFLLHHSSRPWFGIGVARSISRGASVVGRFAASFFTSDSQQHPYSVPQHPLLFVVLLRLQAPREPRQSQLL